MKSNNPPPPLFKTITLIYQPLSFSEKNLNLPPTFCKKFKSSNSILLYKGGGEGGGAGEFSNF